MLADFQMTIVAVSSSFWQGDRYGLESEFDASPVLNVLATMPQGMSTDDLRANLTKFVQEMRGTIVVHLLL